MQDKNNNDPYYAEQSSGQNINTPDSIYKHMPLTAPPPVPAVKPLDKVKEPPKKKRSRDREDR